MSIASDRYRNHQAQQSPHPSLVYKRNLSSGSLKKLNTFQGGNRLQVEVSEIIPNNVEKIGPGEYRCILEIFDAEKEGKLVWKQKTSSQTMKNTMPIIFQDSFKVKNLMVDSYLDVKPGWVMKVSLAQVQKDSKSINVIDSTTFNLNDLIINKTQERKQETPKGFSVLLKFNLVNNSLPRGGTVKLEDLQKEQNNPSSQSPSSTTSPKPEDATDTQPQYALPRVSVKFTLNYYTKMGEELRIVGSNYKIGEWDPSKGAVMKWMGDGKWELELSTRKAYIPFEYKYVVYNPHTGEARWEETPNRKMDSTASSVELYDSWNKLSN